MDIPTPQNRRPRQHPTRKPHLLDRRATSVATSSHEKCTFSQSRPLRSRLRKGFPDPLKYDLIVLSGGKADASSSEPWVLGVLDFVRATAREAPKTKMLGICWGHQAVARALGGEVGAVSTGPIAAIQNIPLTDAGKAFFPFAAGTGSYRAPEFHVREVSKPAYGLSLLEAQSPLGTSRAA